jgi:hypothetical protein
MTHFTVNIRCACVVMKPTYVRKLSYYRWIFIKFPGVFRASAKFPGYFHASAKFPGYFRDWRSVGEGFHSSARNFVPLQVAEHFFELEKERIQDGLWAKFSTNSKCVFCRIRNKRFQGNPGNRLTFFYSVGAGLRCRGVFELIVQNVVPQLTSWLCWETRYLWAMYPVSSSGLSTLFTLHRSRANCSKCGLAERSFKLSDRFERSANSFFWQFARRSTLFSFRSENQGSLIAFERSLNSKERCAQLWVELHKNFNRAKNTNWKLARIELGTFKSLQGW